MKGSIIRQCFLVNERQSLSLEWLLSDHEVVSAMNEAAIVDVESYAIVIIEYAIS